MAIGRKKGRQRRRKSERPVSGINWSVPGRIQQAETREVNAFLTKLFEFRQRFRDTWPDASAHPGKDSRKRLKEPESRERWEAASVHNMEAEILLRFTGDLTSLSHNVAIAPSDHIVNIGAGNNVVGLFLARKLGRKGRLTAVDWAGGVHQGAKKLAKYLGFLGGKNKPKIRYVTGDMEAVPLKDNCCNVVMASDALNNARDRKRTLKEWWRILRKDPNSKLVVFVSNPGKGKHVRRILKRGYHTIGTNIYSREIIDAGFRITYSDLDEVQMGKNFCIVL